MQALAIVITVNVVVKMLTLGDAREGADGVGTGTVMVAGSRNDVACCTYLW